jgi:O-antigen/teichoic acid export membrane protein
MSKLIKNTSIYTIGNILPKAAGFLLLPIYTAYLTPADYGIVNSLEVLSTILVVLFTLSINRSIPRLYFDYKTEAGKRNFLGTISLSQLIIASIMLLLIFLSKNMVSKIYTSIDFYPYYAIAILTTFFSIFAYVPKTYLRINERAKEFVSISLVQFLLTTGGILLFIVYYQQGALGMLKGKLIGTIIAVPFFAIFTLRIINKTINPKILKESLVFSLPMIPSLFSAWILNLSDRIFIERYFDMHDVGIYSMGYQIAALTLIITGAFFQSYQPLFFKLANSNDQEDAKSKLFKYNSGYAIVMIFIVFFITFFSKEMITLFLNEKYYEAYKIVPLIAIAYFISQLGGLLNLSIYQVKKTKQLMYMVLGSAILNIGLNFLLVPRFGAFGAAYATILSFLVFMIIKYFYTKKYCYFIPYRWLQIGLITLLLLVIYFIGLSFGSLNIFVVLGIKSLISLCLIGSGYWVLVKKYEIVKWGRK